MHAGLQDSKMGTLRPYTAQLVSSLPIYLEICPLSLKDAFFSRYFQDTARSSEAGAGVRYLQVPNQDDLKGPPFPCSRSCCKPHPFPARSHYSHQQLKELCALQEHFFFKLNTHSVTALCQKLGILTAELAGEMMPAPGHAFTTQLLRGNPLSSVLS